MDIAEFVRARLDEDEEIAQAAVGVASPDWETTGDTVAQVLPGGFRSELADPGSTLSAHIARHDPTRVLRQVAVLRWILDQHWRAPSRAPYYCTECQIEDGVIEGEWPCDTVWGVAKLWVDHADYDPVWAPRPAIPAVVSRPWGSGPTLREVRAAEYLTGDAATPMLADQFDRLAAALAEPDEAPRLRDIAARERQCRSVRDDDTVTDREAAPE